jgi:hypothetical protein
VETKRYGGRGEWKGESGLRSDAYMVLLLPRNSLQPL